MRNGWKASATKDRLVFSSGATAFAWKTSGDELQFAGVRRSGQEFSFGPGSHLWSIELRDRFGYATLLNSAARRSFTYRIASSTLTLAWRGLAEGRVDVSVAVKVDPGTGLLGLRLSVAQRGADFTVWGITCPALTDLRGPGGSHRKDVLVTTDGFGSAIPDPIRQPRLTAWTNRGYPGGLQSMPFVALLNGGVGLYAGVHDPAAGLCRFRHLPDAEHDRLPLAILIEPEEAGRAQPAVALDYDIVLGVFEGGWYEAALIYRAWALRQPRAACRIGRRADIPEWSRGSALWLRDNFPENARTAREDARRLAETMIRFCQAIGRPCPLHLYRWHDHPFDILYPDYRPRRGVKPFVRTLQRAGIRVMPYINARLFDLDHPDWRREGARRHAAKEAAPKLGARAEKLYTEVYDSMTHMVVMCPSTPYWQQRVTDIVARLVREVGVDAVYLDQVAAAWSETCSDPSHGHPLRGGGWWVKSYAEMMRRIRRALGRNGSGPDLLLTTECNADAYLDQYGNFLMLHGKRNHVVPLFPAVYGGVAPLFAREASPADGLPFRILMAQNILWGCQNGWFSSREMELLMSPAHRRDLAFLKGLCDLFDRMRPYFENGEMGRPPELQGAIRQIPVRWQFCITWRERLGTVLGSRWRRGRRVGLAFVNVLNRAQRVRVPLAGEEAAGRWEAWWAGEAGQARVARGVAALDLPPRSIALLEFRT